MPTFTPRSLERLATCDERLQCLAHEAVQHAAFQVSCGHRDREDQRVAFLTGKSKVDWPHSRHNAVPSEAFDFVPDPLDWNDLKAFEHVATLIKWSAEKLGVAITWGGDWTGFKDRPHIELNKI